MQALERITVTPTTTTEKRDLIKLVPVKLLYKHLNSSYSFHTRTIIDIPHVALLLRTQPEKTIRFLT